MSVMGSVYGKFSLGVFPFGLVLRSIHVIQAANVSYEMMDLNILVCPILNVLYLLSEVVHIPAPFSQKASSLTGMLVQKRITSGKFSPQSDLVLPPMTYGL